MEIVFHLSPLDLFGCGEPGGRTGIFGGTNQFRIDANSGRHTRISPNGLVPLKCFFEESGCRIEMKGNNLHIHEQCQSYSNLKERVEGLYFCIPILLNIEFFDPPFISRVSGRVGDLPFVWILDHHPIPTHLTTQIRQEEIIETTWCRWKIISTSGNERVIAALYYFHIACRLKATGYSPWEFTGATILNLCKSLEALFPHLGDGNTRDAAREGLESLGYHETEIETLFLPVMALRDQLDSGHIMLFDLPREKLERLYNYTDTAEQAFQKMFQKLISKIQEGNYTPKPYILSKDRKMEAEVVIDKILNSMRPS